MLLVPAGEKVNTAELPAGAAIMGWFTAAHPSTLFQIASAHLQQVFVQLVTAAYSQQARQGLTAKLTAQLRFVGRRPVS